jgi:sulfite oxidase
VAPGGLNITARAWDDAGVTQPESRAALWNPRGYGNNAYAHIELSVVDPAATGVSTRYPWRR